MVKVLKMVFRDATGKQSTLKIVGVKNDLTKEVVHTQMVALSKTQLFVGTDGINKLEKPISAAIVTTTVDQLAQSEDFVVAQ